MPQQQIALSNTFNEFRSAYNDAANTLDQVQGTLNGITTTAVGTVSADSVTANNITGNTLTNGRIALVGPGGLIRDDESLTYNVTTNVVTANSLSVTTLNAGATSLSSTLAVTGATTLSNNTTFGSGANVATYFSSNGYFEISKGVKATVDLHADQHIGAGGELSVWVAAKGDNQDTHKVFAIANTDAATDMLVVNTSDGANAYGEFIAIHHSGNTDQGWISMGINSSNYAEGAYGITKADDGYILYQAPQGTTESGDLVIGTGGNGVSNKIIFSAEGFDDPANNTQMVITPGQNIHIEIDTQSSNTTTGALTVNGGIGLVGNLNIGGNVAITGTITLGGGGNTVSTSSLQVDNPIIFLGSNNAADVLDLGFVGTYTSSGTKYTGLVRDANDSGIYKLFNGISNLPSNTVNFTGASYSTLQVGILKAVDTTASSSTTTGALIVSGGAGIAEDVYAGGDIYDSKGNVREVPQNATTGTYTLVAADSGKHVTATGNVTVPQNTFTVGQAITIYNNSSSTISILQGAGTTLRQAGTSNTGTRSLLQYGVCTILCVASNVFVINGGGLT
jgi:membrane-bound inhibitor of C-type lysozyme